METILAFVGFVVVAGFVYFKFVKKKKIAVSVDGKPVIETAKPTPTAVPPTAVPTDAELATASTAVVALADISPYVGDSIRTLLGKLKGVHDKVVAQGPTPPKDAKAWWGNRAEQAGICSAIHGKQPSGNRNTAAELISAAESGDYSKIIGA